MSFQIVYIFEAIDKFTPVAKKIEKSLEDIGKKISSNSRRFTNFQNKGINAFNKIAIRSTVARRGLDKIYRGQVRNTKKFQDFHKEAQRGSKKIERSVDALNKSIKRSTRSMQSFRTLSGKGFKEFRAEAMRAERANTKLNKRLNKSGFLARRFSELMGNLKFRLASLVASMAMTGFGMQKLIDRGKTMEKSFTIMAALTGLNTKELKFLKNEALKFSRVFGIAIEDIFVGFKRVAGLKPELLKDVKALAELTKWTLILDAPMEQIEKVSRALTVALNVYGKSAKHAAEFSNILAAAQRKGSAEVIDMAMSFLKAGSVAESANIPFINVIASLQALARGGLLKQVSGVSFRTIMIRVADAAKKGGGTFEEALKGISNELLSIENPLERVSKAGEIFGKRQAAAGLILVKSIKFMQQFRREIKNTNIAIETANKVLTLYERKQQAIFSFLDKMFADIFEAAKDPLLDLQKQFVIFMTIMDEAAPGGFKGTISFLIWGLARIVQLLNIAALTVGIIAAPMRAALGDVGALIEIPKLLEKIREIENTPLKLDSILTPEDKLQNLTSQGTAGKVSIDLNLKGNTDALASAQATTEGNVELNVGQNLAFIG